jgi:broad specificity phosphatase PhoE
MRHVLTSFLLLLASLSALAAPTRVVIVRHAEKGGVPEKDPELSATGKARAAELARVLRDVKFDTVLTTQYARTRGTAAEVAARQKLEPTVVDGGSDHLARLVAAVRERGGQTILVVGHSNTVPELVAALGGDRVKLEDSEYDDLFLCTIEGEKGSCLQLHYGAVTP